MKIQIIYNENANTKTYFCQLNGILIDQPRLGALSLHSVQVIFLKL